MVKGLQVILFAMVLGGSGGAFDTDQVSPPSNRLKGPVSKAKAADTATPVAPPVSVEVRKDGTIVRLKPTAKARRRGVVMKGARLPIFETAQGDGCNGIWYRVHEEGWICGREVKASALLPEAPKYPVVEEGELTPWPFGFVREPTIEYRMNEGEPEEVRELLAGFGFGIKSIFQISGSKYFRTQADTLIERRAAGMTDRVSTYQGMIIAEGKPWPVGFVNSRHAFAYGAPSKAKKHRIAEVPRFTPFEILEESGRGARRFYKFDEGAWFARRDVRVARKVTRPSTVKPEERWIDVDTNEQIITAYEGDQPVYAALVSTGRIGPSSTKKGEFRIWAKVSAIAMDNTDEVLEEEKTEGVEGTETDSPESIEERKLYSLQDVPWTQFFLESYALHGVYWHNGFGNRRSHGCVNLAPKDARWFYDWTMPRVPDGWWAVHSTEKDIGTLIRVR